MGTMMKKIALAIAAFAAILYVVYPKKHNGPRFFETVAWGFRSSGAVVGFVPTAALAFLDLLPGGRRRRWPPAFDGSFGGAIGRFLLFDFNPVRPSPTNTASTSAMLTVATVPPFPPITGA